MGFIKKLKELSTLNKSLEEKQISLSELEVKQARLLNEEQALEIKISDKGKLISDIKSSWEQENQDNRERIISDANQKAKSIQQDANDELTSLLQSIEENNQTNETLSLQLTNLKKEINRYENQARKFKSDIIGLKNFRKEFPEDTPYQQDALDDADALTTEGGLLDTIIKLPLHSDNSKELKKLSRATRKEIDNALEKYKSRYTTKGNKAIYNLMVIGLQAEMQLLLYQLTYQNLDDTKQQLKEITSKYQIVAGQGNNSILPTVTRFISEIEPLYLELVDIEYRYYIYRQKEKEEQQALKEQMKQEAEERKALQEEKRKLDTEESKYLTEIQRNNDLLENETDNEKIQQLNDRLAELQDQIDQISDKKEEITNLTMGKAGYVYVISNLGSFGKHMFKIGMTRRLEPQQRVDELGSASVPFKFDVHALIFSDDAVGLETSLHQRLADERVNKVNYRKEFFNTDVDSLQQLVEEIDPTAEFTKTMRAEEYKQTIAMEQHNENVIPITA